MFIPDPIFFHPGSLSDPVSRADKNLDPGSRVDRNPGSRMDPHQRIYSKYFFNPKN
jgi:hypothetical protein